MSKKDEALKLALEALEWINRVSAMDYEYQQKARESLNAIYEALAEQPAQDNTYNYAKNLAEAMFKRHFASDEHYASGRIVWGVNDTVIGILTQIDNMVSDMVRRPAQQQEPVARVINKSIVWRPRDIAGLPTGSPLYTSPPATKPWVGLTDMERAEVQYEAHKKGLTPLEFMELHEAKMREKNNG